MTDKTYPKLILQVIGSFPRTTDEICDLVKQKRGADFNEHSCREALSTMGKKGLLENPARGVWVIAANIAPREEVENLSESDEDRPREEVENLSGFPEGAKTEITVNRYERDRRNRKAAIDFHGIACLACNVRMAERYGEIADGFIHIHHTKRLSTSDEYTPDVETDLIPLCPNCHAVVHLVNPSMTLEELKRRLAEATKHREYKN